MATTKEEILQELGLSVNEAKVYVALLQLGATTAGKVAEQCKLHRTNVYDALERLEEKGLTSYILQDDTKIFEAADPLSLTRLIDERRAKLEAILPQLHLDKRLAKKTAAHILDSMKAFKLASFNLLQHQKPIVMFGIPKKASEAARHFVDLFHKTRIEKKILMRHIYNENAQERMQYLNRLPYTEAKYLPERFSTPVSTMVCADHVLIIHWDDPFMCIHIENPQLAEAYQKYFEFLYSGAEWPRGHARQRKTKNVLLAQPLEQD